MPSKGWYVNGLDELLEDSIDRMKGFNRQYMRDMRSLFSVEKVFQGVDMNEYSIPDLKKMALDTIHKKNLLDPAHGGKLPILCKDKKVRYYNPEQWSETIARTRSRALQEKGLHNEMAEAGFDLVIVSIGGSGDMCKHWEGKILSISGKTSGVETVTHAQSIHLFHPNCAHSSSPVIITEDEAGPKIWGRSDLPKVARESLRQILDQAKAFQLELQMTGLQQFAGSVAALKPGTRKYFVYKKISDGIDEDELIRLFAKEYGMDEATARGKVRFYISDLKKNAKLPVLKKDGFLSVEKPVKPHFVSSVKALKSDTKEYFVYKRIKVGVDEHELMRLFAEEYGLKKAEARGWVKFHIRNLEKTGKLSIVKKDGFLSTVKPVKPLFAAGPPSEEEMLHPWLSKKEAKKLMGDADLERLVKEDSPKTDFERKVYDRIRDWTKRGYVSIRSTEQELFSGIAVDKLKIKDRFVDVVYLESFLDNAPKYHGSVARGTNTLLKKKIGDVYETRAMSSFSKGTRPTEAFSETNTVLVIENSRKGADISKLSAVGVEGEVLMPKGRYYIKKIIESFETSVNQKIYFLEEM